jgi:putative PIN family toxin of toxin-antitoxin system
MDLPPFVVFDTNVVLDWLVYQDPRVAPLLLALNAGAMRLASDEPCLLELVDVLSREKIRATAEQRASALATYRRQAHMVDAHTSGDTPAAPLSCDLPQCRDADDQKFIELAVRCRARALVSRDKELLRMHHRMLLVAGLAVVEPGAALAHF